MWFFGGNYFCFEGFWASLPHRVTTASMCLSPRSFSYFMNVFITSASRELARRCWSGSKTTKRRFGSSCVAVHQQVTCCSLMPSKVKIHHVREKIKIYSYTIMNDRTLLRTDQIGHYSVFDFWCNANCINICLCASKSALHTTLHKV